MVATLQELEEAALVQILIEPKNALVKQYQKLSAWKASNWKCARRPCRPLPAKLWSANRRRGLRSILEQVLLDTMYELPGMENVSKVVIDENTISGDNQPP